MEAPLRETEAALLRSALQGDRAAFGRLVELHQPRALALATGILGNREEARDLLQEACLKAFRALKSFVPGRPFFPWFYRILRNACIQALRSRKVRRTVSLQRIDPQGDPFPEPADERTLPPGEIVARDEASQRVGKALVQLRPEDSEILILKHFDGLTYREIAEALSIPVGTVMSRLHAARRRLRRLVPELA